MDEDKNANFLKMFLEITEKYASKEAITYMMEDDSQEQYTFGLIGKITGNWARSFGNYNINKGDRIAIIAPLIPNVVIASLALACSNITAVIIDATLPLEEIARLTNFSDVKGIFTTMQIYHKLYDHMVHDIPVFNLEDCDEELITFNSTIAIAEDGVIADLHMDVMVILFSSGTTSQMKGVMLTYESILGAREKFVDFSGIKPYMSYLNVFPFSHISGYVSIMIYILTGCSVGIIENVNSIKLQKGLLKYNPFCFGMIPKVYDIMADKILKAIHNKGIIIEKFVHGILCLAGFLRKKYGLRIGKIIFKPITSKIFGKNIYGLAVVGTICRPTTAKLFLDLGLEWANMYATTETNAPITSTGVRDHYPINSVGNVNCYHDITIKIEKPDIDGIGEIYVKTPLIMKGYFKEPELTSAAFDKGYFKTGDLGYINKEGYLFVCGRIKETIILHNGEKISASDIDTFYQSVCPDNFIACCGVPNNDGYDEVHLFIEEGSHPNNVIDTVICNLSQKSAETNSIYKFKEIHRIETIPTTSVGKVKRYLLKEYVQHSSSKKYSITYKEMQSEYCGSMEEEVIDIIKSFLSIDVMEISLETKLVEDLQFDSLTVFELCAVLDERFHASIEPYLSNGITVGEIINLIEQKNRSSVDTNNNIVDYPLGRTTKHLKKLSLFWKFSSILWKIDIFGKENINPNENYIICPNHESYFDGVWIIGCLDNKIKSNICTFAANTLFEKRVFKEWLIMLGAIPVHRNGNTASAMRRGYECLKNRGYSLLVHPEGTRTRNGRLGEFKYGAAKLSIITGIKIIPVCIDGAYEIFPPHRKIPRIFDWKHLCRYSLKISFGEVIAPDGKTEKEITEEIRNYILTVKSNNICKKSISRYE